MIVTANSKTASALGIDSAIFPSVATKAELFKRMLGHVDLRENLKIEDKIVGGKVETSTVLTRISLSVPIGAVHIFQTSISNLPNPDLRFTKGHIRAKVSIKDSPGAKCLLHKKLTEELRTALLRENTVNPAVFPGLIDCVQSDLAKVGPLTRKSLLIEVSKDLDGAENALLFVSGLLVKVTMARKDRAHPDHNANIICISCNAGNDELTRNIKGDFRSLEKFIIAKVRRLEERTAKDLVWKIVKKRLSGLLSKRNNVRL